MENKRNEIRPVLHSFANADLRIARAEGTMCVSQTIIGNLEISYNTEEKTYTITDFNNGTQYVQGKAKEAREFLIENYDVVAA